MQLQNIHSDDYNSIIYLFNRDNNGELNIEKKKGFLPYFYELAQEVGTFKTYDKKKARIVYCKNPIEMRKKSNAWSYQSDVPLVRQYIINQIPKFDPSPTRYLLLDIEVQADQLPQPRKDKKADYPVSCITTYDNFKDEYKVFFINDYKSEFELLDAFCKYVKEVSPDLFSTWNIDFDYAYLYHRFPDFAQKISPIDQTRYIERDYYYPAGISIIDFLGLYHKFTLGKKVSYALDAIAQEELGYESWGDTDFANDMEHVKEKNFLDVKKLKELDDKYKIFDFYDKQRLFTKCLWEDLPSENKGGSWDSNNSRPWDMIFLEKAKEKNIALPNKPRYDEDTKYLFKHDPNYKKDGAFRDTFLKGCFYNVIACDLGGAYPKSVVSFCLDRCNIQTREAMPDYFPEDKEVEEAVNKGYEYWKSTEWGKYLSENNIIPIPVTFRQELEEIRKIKEYKEYFKTEDITKLRKVYYVKQDSNAILPSAFEAPLEWKDRLKTELKNLEADSKEEQEKQLEYASGKSLVNSGFGISGSMYTRLYNLEVFNLITFLVRDLINYVKIKLEEKGYSIIFIDTDSFVVNCSEDITDYLNELVKEWATWKYGNNKVDIEFDFEGIFESIFVNGKCLAGDNKIPTNKGNIFVTDIYKNPNKYKILSYNSRTNKKEYIKIKKIWKTPLANRDMYKINLKYNQQKRNRVILTEDHPILTNQGWKEIKNTSKKDLINTGYLTPSKEIQEILLGTILGDASLKYGLVDTGHSIKQKNYGAWKYDICFDKNYYEKESIDKLGYKKVRFISRSDPYIKYLEDIFYVKRNNKKIKIITKKALENFTLRSLAILFCDDGYIKKERQYAGEIATCCFSYKENLLLSKKIKKLGCPNDVVKTGKHYRINFSSENIKILHSKIAKYVPKCMNYKLYPEYRKIKKEKIKKIKQEFLFSPFSKTKVPAKSKIVYDIELQKNHYYLSLAGVIHNCRYRGYQIKNGKLKRVDKGIETKRRDSSAYIKSFQDELLDLVLKAVKEETTEKAKETVINWIKNKCDNFKEEPLTDIAIPCKVGSTNYKNLPIFIRAMKNTQHLIGVKNFSKKIGDRYYYIYVIPVKKEGEKAVDYKKRNVLAFDNKNQDHINLIDYELMMDRNVFNKVAVIFEGLGWDKEFEELRQEYIKPKVKRSKKEDEE